MIHSCLNDSMISSQATGIPAGEDTGGIKTVQVSGRAGPTVVTLDGSHEVGKLLGEPGILPSGTALNDKRERT